jgi:type III pantothenate kinase
MLLTVDIGNTQTSIGLWNTNELEACWAVTTRANDSADEVHASLAALFALKNMTLDMCSDACIASVVPGLTATWKQVAMRVSGKEPVIVNSKIETGLKIIFDNPTEIGADRIADAVAAINEYGSPVVVVDLGTATNIEVINKDGAFCGGIIAPGLQTSTAALFTHAARLPQIDLVQPKKVIGSNTIDAIRSGLIWGEVDRIDGLVHRIFDELGYEACVVATGGLAGYVCEHSKTITQQQPRLTLKGLRLIYDMNR